MSDLDSKEKLHQNDDVECSDDNANCKHQTNGVNGNHEEDVEDQKFVEVFKTPFEINAEKITVGEKQIDKLEDNFNDPQGQKSVLDVHKPPKTDQTTDYQVKKDETSLKCTIQRTEPMDIIARMKSIESQLIEAGELDTYVESKEREPKKDDLEEDIEDVYIIEMPDDDDDIALSSSPPFIVDIKDCVESSTNTDGSAQNNLEKNLNQTRKKKEHVNPLEVVMRRLKKNHYSCAANKSLTRMTGKDDKKIFDWKIDDEINQLCKSLMEKDYVCQILLNSGGKLCANYPEHIIIPVAAKLAAGSPCSKRPKDFLLNEYEEKVKKDNTARCRKRFPVPVLLINGKFVCRAGTLTVLKTKMYETATQSQEPNAFKLHDGMLSYMADTVKSAVEVVAQGASTAAELLGMATHCKQTMEETMELDIEVLKHLDVLYISDLMVEKRKTHSGVKISSSEKVHRDMYENFLIYQMPYPGCEFFMNYHTAGRKPEGLCFKWTSKDVDIEFLLPAEAPDVESIHWTLYKEWDLVEMTQNYLVLLLKCIEKGQRGLLIHCISGWDRTPLFVSLIRLSLWADDLIHVNLSVREMAFFTLAYDWYLFGHNTPTRIAKKEEILHFCFKFLPYIASRRFSIRNYGVADNMENACSREDKLRSVSSLVLNEYEKIKTEETSHLAEKQDFNCYEMKEF